MSLADQVQALEMENAELRRIYLDRCVSASAESEALIREAAQYRARAVALTRQAARLRHAKNALALTTVILPVPARWEGTD